MCGRYALRADTTQLATLFDAVPAPEIPIRWNNTNISPSENIVIVTQTREPITEQLRRNLRLAQWGFLPQWVYADLTPVINARSETCSTKPFFRHALSHARCLIPFSWYYEWEIVGSTRKQPWMFCLIGKEGQQQCGQKVSPRYECPQNKDSTRGHICTQEADYLLQKAQVAAFAGLYSIMPDGRLTAVILTTAANKHVSFVHHRMPVILMQDQWDIWLETSWTNREEIHEMLTYYRSPRLSMAHCQPTSHVHSTASDIKMAGQQPLFG
ncbi:MAG: SOS response-associated peptidase [Actinomycetaceae bacterium]|nr:SOS response-associated peptidase [Actinomycetaceae bacterium]